MSRYPFKLKPLRVELQLEKLKQKILSYTHVEELFLTNQLQQYERFQLKKGDTLVTPGKKVEYFYYLASGCICYYKMEEGRPRFWSSIPRMYFLRICSHT